MSVDVNYLAVFVAAVASMVVGFLWYSPMLFAKPWMKLMGISAADMKKKQKGMGGTYAMTFVGALVMAYVLSHVMTMGENFFHYDRVTGGLSSAFWMWLGFVAPVQMEMVLFGGKKWQLYAINTGHRLVSLLAMGLVLGMWK